MVTFWLFGNITFQLKTAVTTFWATFYINIWSHWMFPKAGMPH